MSREFPFYGPDRGAEVIAKGAGLHDKANAANKELISWLYAVLNILDGKANGLMRVNGAFITILLFFFAAARADKNPLNFTPGQLTAAQIMFALVMLSMFLCFLVVRVSWKFLGHVRKVGEAYDFTSEARRLAEVVDDRTHYYLLGWSLTLIAMLLATAVLVVAVFGPAG